jgi:hypothetical protein
MVEYPHELQRARRARFKTARGAFFETAVHLIQNFPMRRTLKKCLIFSKPVAVYGFVAQYIPYGAGGPAALKFGRRKLVS